MDICKDNDFCGGCIYQGVPYEEQLKIKDKEVRDLLAGRKVDLDCYLGIEGSPSLYGYRNKMEYTFGDLVKDGEMTLGMHRKGKYWSIVTVDECQLVHEDFNKILRATLDFCIASGYDKYHKKTHRGLMRNLIVRRGMHSNQLLVNIVTSGQREFDEEGYVTCISGLDLENEIAGLLHTINDDPADAVKCGELRILRGRDYYMEKVLGLDFKVSAFSFFQTNVEAVERLYSYALSLPEDFSDKTVLDLYSGTGTITQIMATKAKSATGIELVEDAVKAAEENAELNGFENCRFITGDVMEKLDEITGKPDLIVVDPPRMGIRPEALDKIIAFGVKEIVYISCNPKTLAENLYYLAYYGYRPVSIKAFDNFPNTGHTECVALISKDTGR
ncbi:MAG: 23S rRNA (uracil(1939)-C(5))-methyltransferase RlmD [Firmicutes bacterium]|nr:23S rRNA (uracil(1939)-C(5))-methyltransferase RlmD [Bacillota bacterium]